MNTWLHENMDIPPDQFLDNETTLQLLNELKTGLLCWIHNEQPMWHYCHFVFQAGQLHLYAKKKFTVQNKKATFMIQTTDSNSLDDIAIVCKGDMSEIVSEHATSPLLFDEYSNSMFIGTLRCRHMAAFWLTII